MTPRLRSNLFTLNTRIENWINCECRKCQSNQLAENGLCKKWLSTQRAFERISEKLDN